MPDTSEKILVGKIVAAQGLRGELRVQTFTESPMDFQKLKVQSDKFNDGDLQFVRRLNPKSDVIVAKVNGFEDRTSAETLRGTELFVTRDALPGLPVGEYYQTDLIGMGVNVHGALVGTVVTMHNFGAGDILELDNEELVSFSGADVDMENRIIYIK